jgi:hydrogenase expression/formation protein HypE
VTADGTAAFDCPAPRHEDERVLLGHGSGGLLTAELLRDLVAPALGAAGPWEDAAVLRLPGTPGDAELVLSTDAFVVTPRFFPGGDIGSLAVHGTVNDLAMRGAQPVALALSFILEEGLPLAELRRVTESVATAAGDAGVHVVTGDTKVVDRGTADGLYVTTTGLGVRAAGDGPSATRGRPGDVVLVSGPIGLHGTAILSARENLGFETGIVSDSRPLHRLVAAMLDAGGTGVHTLRDPTRGGLATALNELAHASGVGVELVDALVPVPDAVASACDLLGLDPLHVANEGCLVALVDPAVADAVLAAMRERPEGRAACAVGRVTADDPGLVTSRTLVGSTRIVSELMGEQLPRIC